MWGSIEEGLIRFCLLIDSFVYGLVAKLFGLFVELANISNGFFSDSVISSFVNRIYILAGVVALFIITYSLLTSIANPEEAIKGKFSGPKMFLNLVTSVILIALLPTVFNFMYTVQNAILEDNIIGRIFLGIENEQDPSVSGSTIYSEEDQVAYEIEGVADQNTIVEKQGNNLAFSVMNAFIYPNDNNGDGYPDNVIADWSNGWGTYKSVSSSVVSPIACIGGGAIFLINLVSVPFSSGATSAGLPYTGGVAAAACGLAVVNETVATVGYNLTDEDLYWDEFRTIAILDGDFSQLSAFSEVIADDEVTYMPLISTAVGAFLLYMIFSFCLDLGLRAVKLAFYEMIAPIPVLCRILPNNKIFNNWIKVTLTTFMEVFIRMITLFTVVFLASNIANLNIPGGGFFPKMIIIIGIVTFGKQAPKLLSEVLGISSGNMKLGIMDKLNAGTAGLAGGLIGGTVGAATGFLGAGIAAKAAGAGFFAGGLSGMANGWKARGNQFGKQKQSMYKSLGGKGKAGFLGKRSKFDEFGDKLKKAPANAVDKRVSSFENGAEYQGVLNGLYAQNYGLSESEYAEAMNLGTAGIDSELQNYDFDTAMAEMNSQNRFADALRQNSDYDQIAKKMFVKSDFYDKTQTIQENRANFERFKLQRQKEIDEHYITNGGQHSVGLADALAKSDENKQVVERVKMLKKEKEALAKAASLSSEEKKSLSDALNARARETFMTSTSSDSAIKQYKADVELQKKMGTASSEAKASSELAKQLQEFMKQNNIKPDDKK